MHILLSWLCFDDKYGDYKLLARENNWIEANKQYFYGYHFASKYQINALTRLTINLSQLENIYLIFVVEKLKNLRGSC